MRPTYPVHLFLSPNTTLYGEATTPIHTKTPSLECFQWHWEQRVVTKTKSFKICILC